MKKIITRALIIIFSVGLFITILSNLFFQVNHQREDYKYATEGWFSQVENIAAAIHEHSISDVLQMVYCEKGSVLLAVDTETKEILGSNHKEYVGKSVTELGVNVNSVSTELTGETQKINGKKQYCVTKKTDSFILVHFCPANELYKGVVHNTIFVGMYFMIVFLVLIGTIYIFFERRIIRNIVNINNELKQISQGNWNIKLSENATEEFTELSHYINAMLDTLLNFPGKMSKALEMSKIPIGICEYGSDFGQMTATSRVQDILMLSDKQYEEFLNSTKEFEIGGESLFIEEPGLEDKVYRLNNETERFIRVEDVLYQKSRIVVLIDVTEEVQTKRKIIRERDTDLLTGLYNRRAFFEQMDLLYGAPEVRKDSVLVMIDLDHLKYVNDKYGHADGDRYLLTFSELLKSCDLQYKIPSRMGGDEFMLFVFGLEGITEAEQVIEKLEKFRDRYMVLLENGEEVMLEFSMGWAYSPRADKSYQELIQLTDAKMYTDKKQRKTGRV